MKIRLTWYAVACMSFLMTGLAAHFFGASVIGSDKTWITVGIVVVYIAATVWIGSDIHRGKPPPAYWVKYLIGVFPALGLVGTLIGIAALFGLSGGNDDAATLGALGTALYTTLAGIVYSEALGLQLRVLRA